MYQVTLSRGWSRAAALLAGLGLASVLFAEPAAPVAPTPVSPIASLNGKKVDATALAQRIDERVAEQLAIEKIPASPLANDAEFLRRVYLDITGVIPPAAKAAEFLDSKDPAKRSKLIDELLADDKYGRHMADMWQAMLLPRNSDNRRLTSEPLVKWLQTNFNENKPWDKHVTDLMTSTGSQDENGAVTFFLANPTADKMVDTVARQYLGIQLQCAQCHNHPFTDWKQNEYWEMAAFFLKVRTDNINAAAKQGKAPGINEGNSVPKGKNKLPESAKILPAKFLQGERPKMTAGEAHRPVFAKWMTAPENPFFARAMVNRTWHQFFGTGLVNPVDDMHEGNKPTHPELIDELAQQFIANDFDVKFLVRAICNSEAYQRTSKPADSNEKDTKLYSHMAVKVLSAEQLYDSLESVVGRAGAPGRINPDKPNKPAKPNLLNNPRQQFINFFQTEDGADPRAYDQGIPQALRLMNAPQFNGVNAVALMKASKAGGTDQGIEHLYLATLSRRPTSAETQRLAEHIGKVGDRKGYSDILWAIVNSTEFTVNH